MKMGASFMKMGPSALFIATVLLLHRALADNVTTSFILPDGFFWPTPTPVSFVGHSNISSGTTSYTVLCDDANFGFYPCVDNNRYTFSEYQSITQYIIPEYATLFFFLFSLSMKTYPGEHVPKSSIYVFGAIPAEAADTVPENLSSFVRT